MCWHPAKSTSLKCFFRFQCTQFKEDGGTFMLCGGCNRIYYCSKACQQDDWKVGGHREYCKMIARQRAGKLYNLLDPNIINHTTAAI